MHIFSHISSFLNLIFCLFFRYRYFIILSFTLSICSDFISHLFKIILLFMYFNLFLAIFFQQKKRYLSQRSISHSLSISPPLRPSLTYAPYFLKRAQMVEFEGACGLATQSGPPQNYYFTLEMINSFIWPGLHFPFISFMI